jgi:putative oxidoreductase
VAAMGMGAKDLALVPARASLGATMIYHGASKLRGEGPAQTGQVFEQLGLKPGRTLAVLTGLAEVFAGASAILGIGTRLGALAVLVTQGVAVAKIHAPKGFSNLGGGYEFNLLLAAAALGLLVAGPGPLSIHELVERRLQGPRRRLPLRLQRWEPGGVRVAKLLA